MDEEAGFAGDFAGGSLSQRRVVIWGLGLMGGSLALGLRGKCRELVGIDTDPATLALARERGIVDAAFGMDTVQADPRRVLMDGDLIILAAPVRSILKIIERLPELCAGPAVVMDLGSTKTRIVEALERLPERFDPLGGHPMCGKEKFSLQHAEAVIYQGATFALAALERTTPAARALGVELAQAVGANPLWVKPEEHDRWVAATSHTPFLVASALAKVTPVEAAALVGTGFRSTTRLAGSSPEMMVDILATNAEPIREAVKEVREQLAVIERLLECGDFAALAEEIKEGRERYRELVGG